MDKAATFEVMIDVEWDKLALNEKENLYEECWPIVYFKPLTDALASISADEMGANALKDSLKQVTITNENEISNPDYWCKFENGVLKLDALPFTNVDSSRQGRTDSLIKILEDNL